MARILNHKGNLSGIRPLPPIHRERNPRILRISSMVELKKISASTASKKGHYKRDCPDFLKSLLKKGDEFIIFIDESLYLCYAKSTWWVDSGATTHIANSL
jgi:hypothetical protein